MARTARAVLAAFILTTCVPLRTAAEPLLASGSGGNASAPDIAIGPSGSVVVMWLHKTAAPAQPSGLGADHDRHLSTMDLFVALSNDGGRTFEPPRRLNTLTDADMSRVIHGGFASAAAFGTLGVAPDGSIHTLWIDTRRMRSESDSADVYAAVSRDDGRTFARDGVAIEGGVCPCCQLTIAFDGESRRYIGSRQVLADGTRPSTVTHGSLENPKRVGTGGLPWHIAGCPLKPTSILVDGSTVYAASHNGAATPPGIFLSVSRDAGATFGTPVPVHPDARVADAPVMARSGREVLLAWHAKVGADRRVFYRWIGDDGKRLGPVTELPAAAGTTQTPALATHTDGRGQIVWQQGNQILTAALPVPKAANPVTSTDAPALRARLAGERGNVVILNLWATWCAPCLEEVPDLLRLSRELDGRGARLLGVAMDEPPGSLERIDAFRARYFPEFTTYSRGDAEMDAIASVVDPAWNEVLPTTYILSRDGKVHARVQGRKSLAELRSLVEAALDDG